MMTLPTMEKGLLGHFACVADPPSVCQISSSPPVQAPTSSFSQVISMARPGNRGCEVTQADAGACRRGAEGEGFRGERQSKRGGDGIQRCKIREEKGNDDRQDCKDEVILT